jgi:isopentenyl-diphosphate delta-isomerase
VTREETLTDRAEAEEMITAVREDGSVYPVEKLAAHVRDLPHLAVSVFIINGRHMLLQQRAEGKYHSGGFWANACCSHPLWQETPEACAHRRLMDEMNLDLPLTQFGTIRYRAQVGDLIENELTHCFYGRLERERSLPAFNPDEVMATEWRSIDDIMQDMACGGRDYAAWFRIYMLEHHDMIAQLFPA